MLSLVIAGGIGFAAGAVVTALGIAWLQIALAQAERRDPYDPLYPHGKPPEQVKTSS